MAAIALLRHHWLLLPFMRKFMKKTAFLKSALSAWGLFVSLTLFSQPVAQYVFIVTTDGLRTEEVFQGADTNLIHSDCNNPQEIQERFGGPDASVRRERLMPFFWSTLVQNGQVYGNRALGSKVEVTNSSCISYPGYNEMLAGFADDKRIFLNTKKHNPNTTVLDFLSVRHHVAAFSSWDVFPWILNEERSGFLVNAGFEPLCSPGSEVLDEQLCFSAKPWNESVRPDTLTWAYARHYLATQQPDVMFLSLGETDEYAHEGKYGNYLEAARQFDQILEELWEFVQNSDHYRDQTAILITTDHGRSSRHWRQHLRLLKGSDAIWMATAGAAIAPLGEIKKGPVVKQCQMAQTIAGLLGEHFSCEHPVAHRIEKIMEMPRNMPAIAAKKQAVTLQSSLK